MSFRTLITQSTAFIVGVLFATTVSAASSNVLASLSVQGAVTAAPEVQDEVIVEGLTRVQIDGVFQASLTLPEIVTPSFLEINASIEVFPADEPIALVGSISETFGPVPPEFFAAAAEELPALLAEVDAFFDSGDNVGFFTVPEEADELFGGLQIDYGVFLDEEQLIEDGVTGSFFLGAALNADQLAEVELGAQELLSFLEVVELEPVLTLANIENIGPSFQVASFQIDASVAAFAAVPVPAALPLALFGVAALGFVGRKRRLAA